MNPDLKSHLSAKSTWMRLLYMILFVVAFNVAELVTGVVVVVQFLFKLFTGQTDERLQGLGHTLAIYFRQTAAYLTYDTEEMPFPFAPWPDGTADAATPRAQNAAEPPAAAPMPEPPAPEPAPKPPTATKPAARPKPKAKSAKSKRAKKKPVAEAKSESETDDGPSPPTGDTPGT